MKPLRKTTLPVAPVLPPPCGGAFNLYPGQPLGVNRIELGFPALARRLAAHKRVVMDGMGGVMWDDFRRRLAGALDEIGITFDWIDAAQALKPEPEIDSLIRPFLGGDDPLFGTLNRRPLLDFFAAEKLAALARRAASGRPSILYGTGAALAGLPGLHVYVDVPKNEIQFRSRAGSVANLGAGRAGPPKPMYKRFFFADWPPLRAHQAGLLPGLDLIVDSQRPEEPAVMTGDDLRAGLSAAAGSVFRVRPWFEPGPWGGQWMKRNFPGFPPEIPNLAWSFELIAPENGLAFESGGRLLEVSFDFLMFQERQAVLGGFAGRFGCEFPIRFDYLDTFEGGNLSVQCHPRPEYAWQNFGERFTQDESYYITDCAPGSGVFLGFEQGVDPAEFRRALETSFRESSPLAAQRFIQKHPSPKHSLFLIPNGTIHASGLGNLVLEISSTPYIYTFKMYDWLRPDLDGEPRPLNIERAMDNLYFERQGERVRSELVAQPRALARGPGWELLHLPTHSGQFYDVHRLDFKTAIEMRTDGSPHVLNVVEGPCVTLQTRGAPPRRFAYAETFVVPAAAGRYRLSSDTGAQTRVVKAFLKPSAKHIPDYLS